MKQYATPWATFAAWCHAFDYKAIPALPHVVCMYLTSMVQKAGSYGPIKMASAAIYSAHRLAGIDDSRNPTKHVLVKGVRSSAKRRFGTLITRKTPLDLTTCMNAALMLAIPDAPASHVMLATYMMVAFAGFLRYNDITQILVKDVKFCDTHAELFLSQRKNDQYRQGNVVLIAKGAVTACCPVALLQRLVSSYGLQPGAPLFQGFDGRRGGGNRFTGQVITYSQLHNHVCTHWAKVLGISVQKCKELYGLHSLRSGGATAVKDNVCERLFQAHGGWRDRRAMMVYLADDAATKLTVTTAMGY